MNLLDVFLILIVLAFIYKGSQQGITYMVGQIVGIIVGVLVASRLFDDVGKFIQPLFLGNYPVAALTSFVIIFEIINELMGIILKAFKVLAFIATLGMYHTLDKWGGALLGLFAGNLIIGVIMFFLTRISVSPSLDLLVQNSSLVPLFIQFATWFIVLFPEEFRNLPSIIK